MPRCSSSSESMSRSQCHSWSMLELVTVLFMSKGMALTWKCIFSLLLVTSRENLSKYQLKTSYPHLNVWTSSDDVRGNFILVTRRANKGLMMDSAHKNATLLSEFCGLFQWHNDKFFLVTLLSSLNVYVERCNQNVRDVPKNVCWAERFLRRF